MKLPYIKESRRNEYIPKGHGMCWVDYRTNSNIVAPLPLNIIYRVGRLVFVWCCYPLKDYESILRDKKLAGDYERMIAVVLAVTAVTIFGIGFVFGWCFQ